MTTMAYLDEEGQRQTQAELQAILKDMQRTSTLPVARADSHTTVSVFLDQPTIAMPTLRSVTKKLPELHQKTDFEGWLDGHIYDYWETKHAFPRIIHISSIRKLEYIVEQLERQESSVRWNEYIFRHTHGWITIKLEAKIMGYSEVECE